jgi:hypothetical protein
LYILTLEKGLMSIYTPNLVFQQNNAGIHLAKDTKEWFKTHGVYVEDWPAHSPGMALVKSEAFCIISGAYWHRKIGGRLALF